MTFDFRSVIRTRPSGSTTEALATAYGNPEGPGASPSEQGPAWFTPSPAWREANLTKVRLADLPGFPAYPGAEISGVTVHRLVAPVLVATWAEVHRRGLSDKLRTFNGAFAARHMGHDRRRPLSVHAFGAALDFDAAWNGYGVPLEKMQINREVVRCFEECGWTWGGRWTGAYADGMHFQLTDPLPGTALATWQDASAHPAPVAVTPPPKPAQQSLHIQLRNPADGLLRPDWVSVAVDASGRVLLGADDKPRAYYINSERSTAKGLK